MTSTDAGHGPSFTRRTASCLLALGLVLSTSAFAQKAIEMILPIGAGGAMDTASRAIGEELAKKWGESVIPINKPGGGMVPAVRYVLDQGAPDGRTLLAAGLPFTISQFRTGGPAFLADELAPVAYIGSQDYVLYIRNGIPANTMQEFVAWARANPQGVAFASSGVGSSNHLTAEELAVKAGFKMTHVPYTGSGTFMPALMGGHVDAVFDAPSSRQHVISGKIKAMMFASDKPYPSWPELQTSAAAGLAGYRAGTWYGFLVPAKTPAIVQNRLNADINEALRAPAVRARLLQLGIAPGGGPREDFARLLQSESARIGAVIKGRNIPIN
ncbi:MAG: tripartite tricarboxylate transporter substrate binding protein [Burkholderiaceae bacterium]|nr:tripartite tricarboxylate transporter substrate binding protein [Burkholderiaceae bacterium]